MENEKGAEEVGVSITADRARLNAEIAKALDWRVWEDPRNEGRWFMERDSKERPGHIDVALVPDYVSILRNDLKMQTGR